MDIRDEIDAMLDSLKNGGRSVSSVKTEPRTKQEIPPTAVKKATPRKSVYDSMSVDDLLSALSGVKNEKAAPKAEPVVKPAKLPEIKQPAPEKIKAAEMTEPTPEKAVKIEPEVKIPSVKTLPAAKNAQESSIEASKGIKPPEEDAFNSDVIQKLLRKRSQAQSVAAPVPEVTVPEAEVLPIAEETPESPVEELPLSENPSETDFADSEDDEEAVPEEAPVKEKKGFFAGIKALFSKNDSDDDSADEEDADDDFDEDDDLSEDISDEAEIEDTAEISEEKPEIVEEISSDIEQQESAEEVTELSADEPEETRSASELIDAALAAIEDIQTEECFAQAEETEPAASEEAQKEESDEETSSDDNKAISSENLIAGIRENAANTIAEISSEISGEEKTEEDSSETETAEETAADETEAEDTAEEEEIDIDVELNEKSKKSRFVTVLEKILEENPDKISDERSEKTEEDEIDISVQKKKNGKFKQRIYAVCGVIFTVLAVIGLVSVIKYSVSHFRSFTSGEDMKSGFTDVIYPAVIMDIESFNSPSELSSEQIISASLWSLVMSADDMEKYEQTFDVISVPAIDVEAYATRLFGDNLPVLTHTTVGSGELKFYYNDETKSYNVPVNPISFTYEPEIKSVAKNGSEYTVTVDYFKELPAWMKESENFTKEVSKTVEFKLTESGDSYVISSMTVINVNAVA